MRVAVLTNGTRGAVQPYLALARRTSRVFSRGWMYQRTKGAAKKYAVPFERAAKPSAPPA